MTQTIAKNEVATRAFGPTAPTPVDGGHYHYLVKRRERALANASLAVAARINGMKPTYHDAKTTSIVVNIAEWQKNRSRSLEHEAPVVAPPPKPSIIELLAHVGEILAAPPPPKPVATKIGRPSMREITAIVIKLAGISHYAIYSPSRYWKVAHPRMIAMLLMRLSGKPQFEKIGRHFGRDHSTAIHACAQATEMVAEEGHPMRTLYLAARADIIAKWPEAFQ